MTKSRTIVLRHRSRSTSEKPLTHPPSHHGRSPGPGETQFWIPAPNKSHTCHRPDRHRVSPPFSKMPCIKRKLRRVLRRVAESDTISAIMSAAPCRRRPRYRLLFPAPTKGTTRTSGEGESFSCAKIFCAKGSSPFSRAMEARVRRFGLKGPV